MPSVVSLELSAIVTLAVGCVVSVTPKYVADAVLARDQSGSMGHADFRTRMNDRQSLRAPYPTRDWQPSSHPDWPDKWSWSRYPSSTSCRPEHRSRAEWHVELVCLASRYSPRLPHSCRPDWLGESGPESIIGPVHLACGDVQGDPGRGLGSTLVHRTSMFVPSRLARRMAFTDPLVRPIHLAGGGIQDNSWRSKMAPEL